MAVSLGVTTSLSGLGVSTSWTQTSINTLGHVLSEPGSGVTLYLAGTPTSWSVQYTASSLYNGTGSAFVFSSTEPSGWSGLSGTVNFTVYWLDVNGNQQYAFTVPMTASGSFPSRTWTATNTTYGGASVTPTNGITNVTSTTMLNLVISPETTDALTVIPGSAGTTALATPVLAQFFATGSRVSLIVLKDSNSTPNAAPFLVGPYAGTVWTGSGTNPISTLMGSGGGAGTANKGASNCVFSTADTSLAVPILVGWMTA